MAPSSVPPPPPSPPPRCHHCHTYLSDVFAPAAAELVGDGITMATVDIEEAREVQSKSVGVEWVTCEREREGGRGGRQGGS